MPDTNPLHLEQAELNYAYLELLSYIFGRTEGRVDPILGLDAHIIGEIARMRHRKRDEIAACPFALYSLRLDDERFWGQVRPRHIPDKYSGGPLAGIGEARLAIANFTQLALLCASHLLRTDESTAQLTFGIPSGDARRFARLSMPVLQRVALSCPDLLRTRLVENVRFWPDLVSLVDRGTKQQRYAARVVGIQLVASEVQEREEPG